MKTRTNTMTKRTISLFLIVSLLLGLSSACGFGAGESAPTQTPVPPTPTTTPVPPTPTTTPVPPTATSTSIPPTSTQISIPGIDEPIVVENVTVKGFLYDEKIDIQLRLLDAYTKDISGTNTPRDPDNIFLILEFWLYDTQTGDSEWVAGNATLTCGGDEYKADWLGIIVGDDSRVKAETLTFEVPQDTEFRQCVFNLDEHAVELVTFFK